MPNFYVPLPRDVIALDGIDAQSFLQGLVSQDMEQVTKTRSVYTALLTPQGKFLHDFFVMRSGDRMWLDCEAKRGPDLIERLSAFRLRSDVQFEILHKHAVCAVIGPTANSTLGLTTTAGDTRPATEMLAYTDPRNPAIGCRVVGPNSTIKALMAEYEISAGGFETYDTLRISLEIPDGSRDMEIEKSTLLESNFADLNGIDWEKGCYMGQELTARTKYRGLVKRRLCAFQATDDRQTVGEPVYKADHKVGEIRSRSRDHLLVSIKIDALESGMESLIAAGQPLIHLQNTSGLQATP